MSKAHTKFHIVYDRSILELLHKAHRACGYIVKCFSFIHVYIQWNVAVKYYYVQMVFIKCLSEYSKLKNVERIIDVAIIRAFFCRMK